MLLTSQKVICVSDSTGNGVDLMNCNTVDTFQRVRPGRFCVGGVEVHY